MDVKRILIVGPSEGLPTLAALNSQPSIVADAASTVQEAIGKLADSGYDAVICWAERQDELAALIRIRKARPSSPILLVTPQDDDAFVTLARQLGAAHVLRGAGGAPPTTELIREAVRSGLLARSLHAHVERAQTHVQHLRELTRRNRELTELTRRNRELTELTRRNTEGGNLPNSRLRPAPKFSFIPLIVEGDPEAAFRMVLALQKADVFSPFPLLRGRDEALRYLDKISGPDSRELHPLPTLLLVDAELPEGGAVDVLKYARSLPALTGLPVILMGPPGDRSRVSRAYEAGANSYVERPSEFGALGRCVEILKNYWGSLNHGPGSF
jgi:DNA-binding NarL/FixJ family response regulator